MLDSGRLPRARDELISDVLLWTPTYGRAKAGRPARTYIQQLCEDTGCSPEDTPEAMNDREKWRERFRDIRASSATWWLQRAMWLLFHDKSETKRHNGFKIKRKKISRMDLGGLSCDPLRDPNAYAHYIRETVIYCIPGVISFILYSAGKVKIVIMYSVKFSLLPHFVASADCKFLATNEITRFIRLLVYYHELPNSVFCQVMATRKNTSSSKCNFLPISSLTFPASYLAFFFVGMATLGIVVSGTLALEDFQHLGLSSSCRATSTDIPDPLSPLFPIVHRFRQYFRTTSRILT